MRFSKEVTPTFSLRDSTIINGVLLQMELSHCGKELPARRPAAHMHGNDALGEIARCRALVARVAGLCDSSRLLLCSQGLQHFQHREGFAGKSW